MQDVKKDRNKYIGGSDIPIIMGLSPFKTRQELLEEKAGITKNEFLGNTYTNYGNIMEEIIRQHINQKGNYNFIENKMINGDLRYHADGQDNKKETTLEIKTTSMIKKNCYEYKTYLVQLAMGVVMNNSKRGILAVYKRPKDLSYELDKHNLQIFQIKAKYLIKLWEKEILPEIEKFRKDLEKLKKLEREVNNEK